MDKKLEQSYFSSKKFNKRIIIYSVAIILVILGLILVNFLFRKAPQVEQIYNQNSVVETFQNTNQPSEVVVNGPNSNFVKSFYETALFYPIGVGDITLTYSKEPSINTLDKIIEQKPISKQVDGYYLDYVSNIYKIIEDSANPTENLNILNNYLSKNSYQYIGSQFPSQIKDKVNQMDLTKEQKQIVLQNLLKMRTELVTDSYYPD